MEYKQPKPPASHSGMDLVLRQFESLDSDPLIHPMLDALPQLVAILNQDRRIILANRIFLKTLNLSDIQQVLGLRPGAAFHCIHAADSPDGCGHGPACGYCGAVQAVNQALGTRLQAIGEARLTLAGMEGPLAMDVQVCASPFIHQDQFFVLVHITDISDQLRRRALERIFFHDLMNTAGGLHSLSELLAVTEDGSEFRHLAEELAVISETLLGEIAEQRQLSAAETGELEPAFQVCLLKNLIQDSLKSFQHHPAAQSRPLTFDSCGLNPWCWTDPVLARRVIANMIKNALEASPPGVAVQVRQVVSPEGEESGVEVHNQGVMPEAVRLQIFQRSFSTKGSGRGLGTYSMRLLGEQYLGGRIQWLSSPEVQTVFTFWLPGPSRAG